MRGAEALLAEAARAVDRRQRGTDRDRRTRRWQSPRPAQPPARPRSTRRAACSRSPALIGPRLAQPQPALAQRPDAHPRPRGMEGPAPREVGRRRHPPAQPRPALDVLKEGKPHDLPLKFHWFLPTNGGDGRQVVGGGHGVSAGASGRPASVSYLGQIARGAEDMGFEAALTPTGAWCDDAWLSTAMLSQVSSGSSSSSPSGPTSPLRSLAAQMAGTFQNLSRGRLLLNVVTGGESHEQRMFGDFLDKDGATSAATSSWRSSAGSGRGDRRLRGQAPLRRGAAKLGQPRTRRLRSTSAAPLRQPDRRRRHADVYLTWGEPPAAVAEKVEWIRPGRRAGPRDPLRHPDAHHHPRHLGGGMGRGRPPAGGHRSGAGEEGPGGSEGQRVRGQKRMLALNGGSKDDLEIHPNVWAGVGLVRGGAGTALVGSHKEVADRIEEYHSSASTSSSSRPTPSRGCLLVRRGRPADPRRARPLDPPGPQLDHNTAVPFQAAGRTAAAS